MARRMRSACFWRWRCLPSRIGAFSTAAYSAYPDRPIRLIFSHPPGGSADVIARLMQPKLEKHSSASR